MKWLFPRNPLLADRGEGWADLKGFESVWATCDAEGDNTHCRTKCFFLSMLRAAQVFWAGKPHAINTTP
jgi:hypothetical protein